MDHNPAHMSLCTPPLAATKEYIIKTLRTIQAQIQNLGKKLDILENPPPQRRQVAHNGHQPHMAWISDHIPNREEEPPDPPYPPARTQYHHSWRIREDNLFFGQWSTNPKTYITWELLMDELFECYNYSNSRKVEIAISHLKGNALNWWIREASERRRLKYTKIFSWTELKQLLRQRYVPYSFQKTFPNCFDVVNPSYKTNQQRYLAPQDKETYVQEKANYTTSHVPQGQPHIHINQPIYVSKQKDIIYAKEDSIISNQSTLQNLKTMQNREYAKVTHTKVPLETGAEEDSKMKSNPIIAPLNVAAAPTKEEDQLDEILVQKKPSPSLTEKLDREAYIHSNEKELQSMRIKADYSRLLGLGKERIHYTIHVEPHHIFRPNMNQGVIFPLLIKEAPPNLQTNIFQQLVEPQGKSRAHIFNDTNLFSFHVGKSVLRTKPCQGGGNDENLIFKSKQPVAAPKSKEQDTSKAGTLGYQTWDPGGSMRNDVKGSCTIIDQIHTRPEFQPTIKGISKGDFPLKGVLIHKDEDSRFEDMKTLVDEGIVSEIQTPKESMVWIFV